MPSACSSSFVRSLALSSTIAAVALVTPSLAHAQVQPGFQPAPQPYPQQYPPQQYPPQQYPPQQYPPQQYPPQQYPPQQYPPQQYPPQQYPPGGYRPVPPPVTNTRDPGEMTGLYVTSALYGIGSGIWLDALFKIKDPGIDIIMPIAFGAAAPIGAYLWDSQAGPLHRGVPSSVATGLVLGAVEGIAISGVQWQYNRGQNKDWSLSTQTTVTWVMATGGGVGGWAFGEWIRPDPRSMSFIVSGAGWGAISGGFLGIAVSGKDWKDGASVAGLIGYNLGLVGAGALSIAHTPSYESQKYMWLGYGLGALGGCLVFPLYLFSDADAKHGFIGPSLGGIAGLAVAGALTWNLTDAGDPAHAKAWKPPFDVSVLPAPRLDPSLGGTGQNPGGAMLSGSGTF